jgi:histidinol-phosphate/aromatic aminotransferase/cobyric acid decarboxylase-like protein
MGPEPRAELTDLPPAIHGGAQPPSVLDFSTGVSPLPTPAAILEAVRGADLTRYPDPTAAPLRAALAELHGVAPAGVVAGAGSIELVWALARAFAGPGRRGVVLAPAFGEYERALAASGARVDLVRAEPPRFAWRLRDVEAALAGDHSTRPAPALLFICRPSNPCLVSPPRDFIAALAARHPGTLIVVDEAFLPMFEHVEPVAPAANVAVLRSLTKVFALPGLRVGYLLAAPACAAAVQACLPSWNVSAPAQAAGIVAARLLPVEAPRVRAAIAALRRALATGLATLGLEPAGEGGPFLLYQHERAADLCAALAERGVRLRHLASFGLPDRVRIGVRPGPEQERLLAIWRGARSGWL